jgi:hypothetical protein
MTEKHSKQPEKEVSEAEMQLRKRQLDIIDSFGTIDFDPNYDYKAERRRKRGIIGDELS